MKITQDGLLVAIAFTALFGFGCKQQETKIDTPIFEKGELLSNEIITGKAWHKRLVGKDSTSSAIVGNEEFEAVSRNVWHSHLGGQILIVTSGVGYHQIKGQAIQVVRKGDVVKCPPDAVHWHGASKDSGVTQIYFLPNTDKGEATWFERVTDDEYSPVK